MIMRRGRSLDEKFMSAAEPRRRNAASSRQAQKMLGAKGKQASMTEIQKPKQPPRRLKSKGRKEMRGATARGINHILQNADMSLPVRATHISCPCMDI